MSTNQFFFFLILMEASQNGCSFYLARFSLIKNLFNRDLNRWCLVYKFSLRFSGSKLLINLRRQFQVRQIFSCTLNFSCTSFRGICMQFVFKTTIPKMRNLCCRLLFYQNLLINTLLTSVFVLVNGIVFSRSNGLIIQCLIACLMN